jgi:hypothetical protein
VTFNPGEIQQSVLVSTVANAQIEANEVFEGVLTLLPGSERIILGNDRATATIEDTSSKANYNNNIIMIDDNVKARTRGNYRTNKNTRLLLGVFIP